MILFMGPKLILKLPFRGHVYLTPLLDLSMFIFAPNNWYQSRAFDQNLMIPKVEDMVPSILDEFF